MTALRRRMSEDRQRKYLSPRTQATYLGAVSRFARHFGKSPEVLGPELALQYLRTSFNPRDARSPVPRCGQSTDRS